MQSVALVARASTRNGLDAVGFVGPIRAVFLRRRLKKKGKGKPKVGFLRSWIRVLQSVACCLGLARHNSATATNSRLAIGTESQNHDSSLLRSPHAKEDRKNVSSRSSQRPGACWCLYLTLLNSTTPTPIHSRGFATGA